MKTAIILLTLLIVFSSGFFVAESYSEVSENQAFLLEGSGFAVTEDSIKISEIDLGLSSQQQRGSSINFLTEDGFVTLDSEEFIFSELEGKFLREGRYIRVNGNVESSNGFDTSINLFGRLVDESKNGAIYGFTGRITTSDDIYKVIYTAKLSSLSKIDTTSVENTDVTIRILKGSSSQSVSDNYIDRSVSENVANPVRLGYFSDDRISVEPGTTITLLNDDDVSHSILSGKENYGDRHNPFTPDNRISTGEIPPGKSINLTFDDAGFYRLYDPDYPWMKIIAYVFPESDSLTLGEGQNAGN